MAIKEIKINSIWGGASVTRFFPQEGQFDSSIAVDPHRPAVATETSTGLRASGMVAPVAHRVFSQSEITSAIVRQISHPKDDNLWTVQANGRVVVNARALSTSSGETLIGTVTGSNATWAEYYNNYIYIFGTGASKDDVSRVGPLNTLPYDGQSGNFTVGLTVTGGSSGATGVIVADVDGGATGTLTLANITGLFTDNETITDTSTGSATVNRSHASLITDNVWKGATLGTQTALGNILYPIFRNIRLPNHVAYVHGDDSLYFADFVNGQGMIHRIHTKRVTNEGDTNDTTVPSLYNALDLPFGFYPTTITGYGTSVLIAGIYTVSSNVYQGNAAFVLWDPTDTVSFYLGPIYLPDPVCTASLNANGLVYLWTGNLGIGQGHRMFVYNGGDSVTEVVYNDDGFPPLASAVSFAANRIFWGSDSNNLPADTACVYSYGPRTGTHQSGLQSHTAISSTVANPLITSILPYQQTIGLNPRIVVAWKTDSTFGQDKFDTSGTATVYSAIRWMFNIGKKFEIKKISIPMAATVSASTTITPTLYFDNLTSNKVLTTITSTNYPSKNKIVYRGAELKDTIAHNDFMLQLVWSGQGTTAVNLPITIEIDVKEDEE